MKAGKLDSLGSVLSRLLVKSEQRSTKKFNVALVFSINTKCYRLKAVRKNYKERQT